MYSNDYATVQSLPRWWSGPAASTPLENVLTIHTHHGSMNGRPSLERYPRCCSPPYSNLANWVATSLGMNSGVSLCSKVKCSSSSVNGMISLTSTYSTLRQQVGMYVTLNVVNLPVWLLFTCKVVHQTPWRSVHICTSYCQKMSGTFLFGHGV